MLLAADVATDQFDYAPGSTALITTFSDGGSDHNFQVGEAIQFQVFRIDGIADNAPGNLPWKVTDGVGGFDAYVDETGIRIAPDRDGITDGRIETDWFVGSEYANSSLEVRALGLTSGESATEAFHDSAIVITSNTAWSQITTGSGTNGRPTANDTIVVNQGVTLAVDVNGAVAGAVTLGNGAAGTATLVFDKGTIGATFGSLANNGTATVTFNNKGSTLTVGTANTSTTFAGTISGEGSLTKTGSGGLTLIAANTYSGGTRISGGFVAIGLNKGGVNGDSISPNGTSTSLGSGTIDIAAGASLHLNTAGLNIANAIILNGMSYGQYSGGPTPTNGGPWNGAIMGASVAGKVSNTISGTITLNATSNITTNYVDKKLFITGKVTGPGGLVIDNTAPNNRLGSFVELDNPANDYQGDTTVQGGNSSGSTYDPTLRQGAANAIPSGAGKGNLVVNGQLDGGGYGLVVKGLSGSGTIQYAPTLQVGNSDASGSFSGIISGNVVLTKVGAGTFTLSGANTFTGGTNINGGVLALGSTGALGTTGTISFGGGTLQHSANNTTSYAARFSTADNQPYSIDTNGQNVSLGAALTSSSGSLRKLGAGTLTLSGTNTYTGGTIVSAGTLAYSASNQLSDTGSVTVTGGTLALGGYTDTVGAVSLLGEGTITGGVVANADFENVVVTEFAKPSGASWSYTNNAYISANDSPYGFANTTSGSQFAILQSYSGTVSSLSQTISLTTAGYASFAFRAQGRPGVSHGPAGIELVIDGTTQSTWPASAFTSGAWGDYISQPVSLSAGTHTLQFRNITDSGDVATAIDAIRVNLPGLTGSSYDLQSGTVSANLGGSAALAKTGPGTVTLSGANTFTGDTTINGGVLKIDASNILPDSGAVILNGGSLNLGASSDTIGSLTGPGTVTATTGVLTVTGRLAGAVATGNIGLRPQATWSPSVVLQAGGTSTVAGLTVAGSVDLGGSSLDLAITGRADVGQSVKLVDNDGSDPVIGSFAGLPGGTVFLAGNGQTFRIDYAGGDGNDVVLTRVLVGLTVTGITVDSRPYDGGTIVPLNLSQATLGGLLTADSSTTLVTAGATGAYGDPNASSNKPVTVTGLSLTGALADNYVLLVPNVLGTIAKAAATISVTGYTGTYDGASHTATGTAKGVLGETLAGLSLAATARTNAGTSTTDAWTFTDATGNYENKSGTVTTTIAKANPTVSVTGYTGTYDGASHTATGTAKGVLGETLAGLSLAATARTNAGTSTTDAWTFTDATGNYENKSGTVTTTIAKANPTVSVTGYTGTYDGASHTATGTAKGVLGETLAGLSLAATARTNAGTSTTDAWTFTDSTGNYENKTGTVTTTITKAAPTISVTGYSGTYDGASHTATGTAKGVLGETLAGLSLAATARTNAGTFTTDAWTFTDSTGNYESKTGSVTTTIAKANPTVSVTGYTGTYDGASHTATGTAKGVLGETLAGLDLAATAR
ncbi:MAG: autotransporter-associated beta strand repeat-containing protein, partial [Planctomycetia bacterium]